MLHSMSPYETDGATVSITPLPHWRTVPEVAEITGLSEWTIRKEIREQKLRARRIGRVLRVLDADLAEWMTGMAS